MREVLKSHIRIDDIRLHFLLLLSLNIVILGNLLWNCKLTVLRTLSSYFILVYELFEHILNFTNCIIGIFNDDLITRISCSDKPDVKLTLGRSLNPSNLKEGNDVFFECAVDANPPPYKITWYHEVSIYILTFWGLLIYFITWWSESSVSVLLQQDIYKRIKVVVTRDNWYELI